MESGLSKMDNVGKLSLVCLSGFLFYRTFSRLYNNYKDSSFYSQPISSKVCTFSMALTGTALLFCGFK